MRPTFARALSARPPQLPFLPPVNPYQTKKIWPPDMSQMTRQEQLRYEKKYKRRVLLACHRPGWDKGVRLAMIFIITGYLVYSVGFGEYEWYGRSYRPRDELMSGVMHLWGVLSPENLRTRNPNAPAAPEPKSSK